MPFYVVYRQLGDQTAKVPVEHVVADRHAYAKRWTAAIAYGFMVLMAGIFHRMVRQPMPDFQIVEAPTIGEAISKVARGPAPPPES